MALAHSTADHFEISKQEAPRWQLTVAVPHHGRRRKRRQQVGVAGQLRAHFGMTAPPKYHAPSDPLRTEFDELADEWHAHTDHLSVTWRMVMHPAYQKMIGMGSRAVPHILRHMKQGRGTWSWLWALESIARRNVADGISDWPTVVKIWDDWAKAEGYIA